MKQSIGVDIGGTKIAVAIITEDGRIENRHEIPTDTSSKEALFEVVVSTIQVVLDSANLTIADVEGIGVGLPGKVDVANGIAVFQNNIPWANFPIVARLREYFGIEKVRIDNDVKVAAYAEYRLANLNLEDMFGYITISTGIACTNIVNDTILRGSGFSGEVGFLPVPSHEGMSQLEQVGAGPGIEKYAQVLYQDNTLTTKDVFERYVKGEEHAVTAIDQSIYGVALALFSMICLLDPKMIVLGGSVAIRNPWYIERVKEVLSTMMHAEQLHVLEHFRASTLPSGDNGIIGAGMLVL